MKICTLVEGSCRKGSGFLPGEGLSLWVEHGGHRVLFDTGASDAFIYNATLLGIDLASADACVISHAHSRHTGGLPHFMEINSTATVWMKRAARGDFFIRRAAGMEPHGIDPALFDRYADRIRFIDGDTQIFDGVTAAGVRDHRRPPRYASRLYERRGEMVRDALEHELYMAVRTGASTAVLTGCTHHGVINMLQCAEEQFGPISAVVGGFHLGGARRTGGEPGGEVRAIARYLEEHHIKKVYTGFCTGRSAMEKLELHAFARRLHSGDVVEI